jgi:glyoxylase-like metal-dependent hydrolase (beta-lactamase superfamily II)
MSIFLTISASLRSALEVRRSDRLTGKTQKDRSMTSPFTITRFAGRAASVNSWIVSNRTHVVVIDALRSESEAAELAETIKATGKTLYAALVTHGHADHYIGLRTLKDRFPGAHIFVASQAVKDDIIGFSMWMESVGWLDQIPRMKPKSAATPDGFDYAATIEVLDGPALELPGGGRLEIRSDYPAIEAAHMTTIYLPQANVLFTSDIVYNGVHAWAGPGVARENIENWRKVIAELKARFAHTGVTLYPGHGAPGGVELLDVIRSYLSDFLAAAAAARSNVEMTRRLVSLYPAHEQADFLLAYSVQLHGPDKLAA